MKKLTLLKSFLLSIVLMTTSVGAWSQTCNISDDFSTLTTSTSYAASITTSNGWNAVNAAVFEGGTTNASPKFSFIGSDATTKAVCINGKTSAVGIITSPTLSGGCASISFKYGNPFTETNGAKFTVEIKQNGTTVWSEQVVNTTMTITTAYTYSKTGLSISGDFTVVITNNSPSASTSNKDRVAIWGICIMNASGTAAPTFSPAAGTYTLAQDVTISSTATGAKIYYTTDGTDPNNTGNGTLYSSPVHIAATTTLKAIAYDASGVNPSPVVSALYTITGPTITVTEVLLPNYATTVGSTQDQTITVSGVYLTEDIAVAITGTDAAQFAVTPATLPQTDGSVNNGNVTISYQPTAPGNHSATVQFSSNGAVTVTRALTGTATLAAPVANAASDVSSTGFKANWNGVSGATSYEVNVYTKSGDTKTPVSGSPFTVNNPATVQAITGLDNTQFYYYTVTAKNGTYSSPESNEIAATLLSRVSNPSDQLNLWSVGNKVYFRAAAGEAVELFNVTGQKIVSRIATDGINEITVSGKGIVFVKAGSLTGKVLIH